MGQLSGVRWISILYLIVCLGLYITSQDEVASAIYFVLGTILSLSIVSKCVK